MIGYFVYFCNDIINQEMKTSERITPSHISALEPGEVFVFGSNIQGMHMGGAARVAMERFGAVWGVGEGLQGQSYALPTMEGIESLEKAVARFVEFARQHPELRFLVTAVGCGIAGYTAEQVAPFFKSVIDLQNVYLPQSFWDVILA